MGEVGEELLGQFPCGHVPMDRECRRLDKLAGLRRDRLDSHDAPRSSFDNHLDESAGIEIHQCAGHVVQRENTAVGLDARHLRLRLG